MDNVTVIVDNTIQDVTVQVATTGITIDQANQIVANTAKVTYPSEDSTKVGFISVTQAVDLDTIESDTATNNAKVSDINHVTLELPNVDNTSDANKPISTATQTALDLKVDVTDATLTTANIFKSVSLTMDFSDRVVADGGTIESRNCVMNEYLKILN